jgi:hypothetical protein
MHFTPTSASWLNMVERFFRDLSENRIKRDSFTSVAELELAIDLYIVVDGQCLGHPGQGHAGEGCSCGCHMHRPLVTDRAVPRWPRDSAA